MARLKSVENKAIVKFGSNVIELLGPKELIFKLFLEHFSDGKHKVVDVGTMGYGSTNVKLNGKSIQINYNVFTYETDESSEDYYLITKIPQDVNLNDVKPLFPL